MTWTIFDRTTGAILRTVSCPVSMLHLQFDQEAQGAVDGAFDSDTHYITDGIPVAKPARPTPHHVFDYTTKVWIDPRTPETEWPRIRAERDRLLLASDWTQLPDVPLATKEAWAAYRQALRDVTLQPDPLNITWPAPPV